MKFKTTTKEIKNNYKCIALGYCEVQHLLSWTSPQAYTCGVYGWNFDAYIFGGVALCTGYRGMPSHSEDYKAVHELANSYEKLAENVYKVIDYDERQKELERLTEEFVAKAQTL